MNDPASSASDPTWRRRLLSTTRGRILVLIRQQARTVGELARLLGITANAVRGHLASLERDGLIEVEGVRREGVGKPPRLYIVTPAAEELFPKAYDLVLAGLLDVLEEAFGRTRLRSLLRQVGRRTARVADASEPGSEVREPLSRAVELLAELGAEVTVDPAPGGTWLRGHACPLGGLVRRRPELCEMLAALLEEVTRLEVSEGCRRENGAWPRCAFLVGTGGAAEGGGIDRSG